MANLKTPTTAPADRPVSLTPLGIIDAHDFVEVYNFCFEDGRVYVPVDHEKAMLEDAINGYIAECEQRQAERPVPQVREALEHVTELLVDTWHHEMEGNPENEIAVIDAREALTARPSDAAVAWRWVTPDDAMWNYSDTKPEGLFTHDELIVQPLYAFPPDEPARVTPSTVGGEALDARVVAEVIIDAAFNETNPPAKRPRAKGDRRELMVEILADCIRKRLSPTIASEKEPVQADGGASERVCDHPTTEKAVTADDLWMAIRERDAKINAVFAALKTEEKYLHDTKDESDLMHGDIEGAFHRLRQTFYTSNSSDPVIANQENLLGSQPEPASEKECGKAVGEEE